MERSSTKELSFGRVDIYHREVLGIGSYGKVCKGKCGQLPCAAKLMHDSLFQENDPNSRLIVRFQQECQFLSTIKHPNVVQYLGTVSDPRSRKPILLIELMDENLTRFLERSPGPLPYHTQLNICYDVALALAYLHFNSIIHRDLSSNNVLLIGEGARAKVTDFGMSKLMDMSPHMTPLTQVPGTAVYMPPEALSVSPNYSSKLDCFSHGVLTLQVITRNFPAPGPANRHIEDRRFPTGRVSVFIPEAERRKSDIDRAEPSHRLLPIALSCIKDRDTERPSADELCARLADLTWEPRYRQSLEQGKPGVLDVRKLLAQKDEELEREKADHQRELIQLSEEYRDLVRTERRRAVEIQREREEKENLLRNVLEAGEKKDIAIQRLRAKVELMERQKMKCTWKSEQEAPELMSSVHGVAVVHGDTAYFSCHYNLYTYTKGSHWSKGKPCKYENFGMAIVKDKLTTVGGSDSLQRTTKSIFTLTSALSGKVWKEVLPALPTERVRPAVGSTKTHLIVAGGRSEIFGKSLSTVEVLNVETLQWSTARSLPRAENYPKIAICKESVYVYRDYKVLTCLLSDIIKPSSSAGSDVWKKASDIPTQYSSTLVALKGHLLAIGGADDMYDNKPTAAIYCYDALSNSWSALDNLQSPKSHVLATVLPSNELLVVGGGIGGTAVTEVGTGFGV